MILGICQAKYTMYRYETMYDNVDNCYLIGTIVGEIDESEYTRQYVVRIIELNNCKKYKNTRILVKEKKSNKAIAKYGDKVRLYGQFKKGEVSRNYGGYSQKDYLYSQKIYGIVSCGSGEITIVDKNKSISYSYIIGNIRKNIEKNLHVLLKKDLADLACGILLGNKNGMSQNTIKIFSDSNLSHILAVSGMHLNYIVKMIPLFFFLASKKRKKYYTVVFICFFCDLVGDAYSVRRAIIMTSMTITASLTHRKSDSIINLLIASFILIIENPYAVKNTGFCLSFVATLGIILYHDFFNSKLKISNSKILEYIKNSIVISLSSNIFMIPILAIYYNKISFTFLLSNLIAGFLVAIIMPLLIICVVTSFLSIKLACIPACILKFFLSFFLLFSNFVSKIKVSNIMIKTPNIVIIFLCEIIALCIPYVKNNVSIKKIIKCSIIFCGIILCFIQISNVFDNRLHVYFIDVGQGDSTLIVTPCKKTILIDGGGSEGSNYVGEDVLVPYLLDRKVSKIDYVVVSHFDTDHVRTDF